MLINIAIFELPLIRIHSTVSSKLLVCIFNSSMCYSPGSTNAMGHGCWASPFSALFTLIQLTGTELSSLTQITETQALSLGCSCSVPGAAHEQNWLHSCSSISHFAYNTCQVTEKKKYNLFYRGTAEITKWTLMYFTNRINYQRHHFEKY